MTLIQQQRVIGSVLLLCILAGIAYFLLSNIDHTESEPAPQEIDFDSSVKPISNNDDAEIFTPETEVLVNPHQLETTEPEPKPVKLTEPTPPKQAEPAPAPAPAPKPTTTAESVKTSWVLQLGSFSVKDNASSLTQKVKKLGYPAMMDSVSSNGKKIYRVRLKPTTNKSELEKAAKALKAKLSLSPQIRQVK